MSADFTTWMNACLAQVEVCLDKHLATVDCAPARLHEAMRYIVLGGDRKSVV